MNRVVGIILFVLLGGCQSSSMRAPSAVTDASSPDALPTASIEARWELPGPFSELTTRADLEARFGAAQVELVETRDAEGHLARELVLFPRDPSRRAFVAFHDDEHLAGLASISVRDAGSRWRGKLGVRIGMSLAELRVLNRKPFFLHGFDETGRGSARDQWSPAFDDDDGQLGALDVDGADRLYFGVELALRAPGADADTWPRDEYLSSDDPRWPRLGEAVVVSAFSAWSSLDDEWQ